MKQNIILFSLSLILSTNFVYGQANDNLLTRLHGISNNGIDFFNIDGIEITTQKISAEFTPKDLARKFKNLSVKEKEIDSTDIALGFPNFYGQKTKSEIDSIFLNVSYYFIEYNNGNVIGISFSAINKTDPDLEKKFVRLVKENAIPAEVYSEMYIDSINFAGRKIALESNCRWAGINNVQCPYNGQMNWSVHKTFEDAEFSVNTQFTVIISKKGGKLISDTTTAVIFEGTETIARKIVYDVSGVKSASVGTTGGKTFTAYFVAAPVGKNFVSCVMSFWNNDQINPNGLPALLEKVMKLK